MYKTDKIISRDWEVTWDGKVNAFFAHIKMLLKSLPAVYSVNHLLPHWVIGSFSVNDARFL